MLPAVADQRRGTRIRTELRGASGRRAASSAKLSRRAREHAYLHPQPRALAQARSLARPLLIIASASSALPEAAATKA
jgi:hypothetical protein